MTFEGLVGFDPMASVPISGDKSSAHGLENKDPHDNPAKC